MEALEQSGKSPMSYTGNESQPEKQTLENQDDGANEALISVPHDGKYACLHRNRIPSF